MDRQTAALLHRCQLFSSLSPEWIAKNLQTNDFILRQYGKGAIIHLQNERCHTLDVVLDGKAVVHRIDDQGRILTISSFSPGDDFGGNLIFARVNQYPMTISASDFARILHIKRDFILQACGESEAFLKAFLGSVSDKIQILTGKLQQVAMKTIREQILDFLRFEIEKQQCRTIHLPFSKTELAQRFGISRTSLSRELQKMRDDKLIAFDRNTITLLED